MSNVALIAASSAAAAAREADERLSGKLLAQNAVSETRAVLLAPENTSEARAMVRLLDRGVLREAGEGRYWIDQAAHHSGGSAKRRGAVVALAAAAILLAGLLVLLAGRRDGERAASIDGVTLVHAAGYQAERRGEVWVVRPDAAAPGRQPVEIEVALVSGELPREGDRERVDRRRLRRNVETVTGGSSGEGRRLIWRERVGDGFVEYRQLAYADGAEPAFELDRLIRDGQLLVR